MVSVTYDFQNMKLTQLLRDHEQPRQDNWSTYYDLGHLGGLLSTAIALYAP